MMKLPEQKYRVFNCLKEVNTLMTDNLELRVVYVDIGCTIVPKIGLFDRDIMLVAHSRLDSILDQIELEMGVRWMDKHNFYP